MAAANPTTQPRTRRSLLTAAAGGLAGLVAAAVGKPRPAQAAAGDPLIIGNTSNNAGTLNTTLTTNSSGTALLVTQNGSGTALRGSAVGAGSIAGFFTAQNGTGISGVTGNPNSYGVFAQNNGIAGTAGAVRASGGSNHGVVGTTNNVARYAVVGTNSAVTGDGVAGVAGVGGSGVIGFSESGYGVFSAGTLGTNSFLQMEEVAGPGPGPAGMVRIYVREGTGGQEVLVQFESGEPQVIATQVS
jgi:hypothetical protein